MKYRKNYCMAVCMVMAVLVSGSFAWSATITAEADAYIKQGAPDTNFGSEPDLQVNFHGDLNYCLRSYIRFDIGSMAGSITDVSLNLTLTAAWSGSDYLHVQLYGLSDGDPGENWDENTITWNNAPTLGSEEVAYIYKLPDDAIGSVDSLTPLNAPALLSFLNSDTDGKVTFIAVQTIWWGQGRYWASKENENYAAPTLEVVVPEPMTMSLLGVGGGLALLRRKKK